MCLNASGKIIIAKTNNNLPISPSVSGQTVHFHVQKINHIKATDRNLQLDSLDSLGKLSYNGSMESYYNERILLQIRFYITNLG